jgi:hypothetical protein
MRFIVLFDGFRANLSGLAARSAIGYTDARKWDRDRGGRAVAGDVGPGRRLVLFIDQRGDGTEILSPGGVDVDGARGRCFGVHRNGAGL